jgi:hypothetical protein
MVAVYQVKGPMHIPTVHGSCVPNHGFRLIWGKIAQSFRMANPQVKRTGRMPRVSGFRKMGNGLSFPRNTRTHILGAPGLAQRSVAQLRNSFVFHFTVRHGIGETRSGSSTPPSEVSLRLSPAQAEKTLDIPIGPFVSTAVPGADSAGHAHSSSSSEACASRILRWC